MKKYIIIIGLILAVIGVIYGLSMRIKNLNSQLDAAQTNTKALMQQNLELDNSSRTLKLTIDQLEYAKDSISKKLITALKDNNVNKKKIQQLQYQLTTNFRVDTITFRDTLFREYVDIDTTIRDQWYSLDMRLKSPSTLVVSPQFRNESILALSYKKETINPPKKFFLWRWFQKKHIITEALLVNNNPYCNTDTTRVIEIVKY